jgi:hypothetical protein
MSKPTIVLVHVPDPTAVLDAILAAVAAVGE